MVSWFCNTVSLVKGYVGHRTKAMTVFYESWKQDEDEKDEERQY